MPLKRSEAVQQTKRLLTFRQAEQRRLGRIYAYLRDERVITDLDGMDNDLHIPWRVRWLPPGAPREVLQLAEIARVNLIRLVVNAATQSLYVDGFRAPRQDDSVAAWEIWQRNRFAKRQIGVHRAAIAYGASYVTMLPGDPVPVMRGASPRDMTVVYGEDDDWPVYALERRKRVGDWRLFDDEAVYHLEIPDGDPAKIRFLDSLTHDAGVTPVIRYRETEDLDDEVLGEVEPLIFLQDQINVTTFGLLVAQHYSAFKQRYILGWLAENEADKLKATASKLWTFEDHPNDIQVGEFSQTDPSGYIASREATVRHLSAISQTPAHELIGQLVNMSADALSAAEASSKRKDAERRVSLGESHDQALSLGGALMGDEPDPMSEIQWQDTETRSLAQTADALGKLAQMLGIPQMELWEKIPGVTQQEINRWKAAAEQERSFADLAAMLNPQPQAPEAPAPNGVRADAGA